ncbi:hypothetical protein SUGI_0934110 [Cryptomeria japonica]|nr:hypothetical protein SUGI_0934110 [Cryptomeria japonica]
MQSCNDANGIEPRPHWITSEFGGHNIKRVLENEGVLEDINRSIVAIIAKKGAHHVDLIFATNEDPKWLVQVRNKEIHIVERWLMQYYKDLHAI